MADITTSGVYRNRFRLIMASGLKPEGFIHDDSRMPDKAVDLGTAIIAGSVWDGDNRAAFVKFDITEISGHMNSLSGTLEMSDYKSHMRPGLAVYEAGIGDNADCQLSGIETLDANTWRPIVEAGAFFDLETQLYLHSSGSLEQIVTGTDLRTALDVEPAAGYPITFSTFFMDKWGKAYAYEQFQQKVRFTGWSGLDNTLQTVPRSDPPLYRPSFSGIRWYDVDTTKFEFTVDKEVPELIRTRNITSGVHAILRKVPYARNQYQLPLIPVVDFEGTPTINVYAERVEIDANGLGTLAMEDYGTVGSGISLSDISGVVVTSGNYARLDGSLSPSGTFIPTQASVDSWPGAGTLWIDNTIDTRNEMIDYISAGTSGFLAAGVRWSGVQHRDGSQIRFFVSGFVVSGTYISGTSYTGDHFVDYTVVMDSVPDYNEWTGLVTLSGSESVARADLDLTYYRGIALCYEPSGLLEYTSRPAININPLVQGNVDGMLWFSTFPARADKVKVTVDKNRDTDNIVGPVFAGNDFLALTATVVDRFGAPVADELVSVSLDNVQSIGKIDGVTPLEQEITKETNSRGEARFVYTPPDTIHGLGYFTQFSNIVNSSGLEFAQTFELKEMLVSGTWEALTFAVWNDDEYDTWSETSGVYEYTADGRFEIIAAITAGSLGTYATFAPIVPVAAYDADGNLLGTSGLVKTLYYEADQLPGDETEIGAFFVSAEKQVSVGVVAPNSNATSKTMQIKVGIPPFMKGELYFGPLEDVDTRSLDSLAYLTINPYTMGFLDEHRFDPRQLGNVFRIQGTKTDEYLRNKFYIIPDWNGLNNIQGNNESRKFFSFRNRFILEVD